MFLFYPLSSSLSLKFSHLHFTLLYSSTQWFISISFVSRDDHIKNRILYDSFIIKPRWTFIHRHQVFDTVSLSLPLSFAWNIFSVAQRRRRRRQYVDLLTPHKEKRSRHFSRAFISIVEIREWCGLTMEMKLSTRMLWSSTWMCESITSSKVAW